jgi:chitodextrinase
VPGEERLSISFNSASNVRFRNNIFYLFDGYGACFYVYNLITPTFTTDYNLLHSAHLWNKDLGYAGSVYTFDQWQALGYDQHSVIKQTPLFRNFPAFAAKAKAGSTSTRIYYTAPSVSASYPVTFATGDYVEFEYDGVVRRVQVSGEGYIDLDIPLNETPVEGEFLLNWKTSNDFNYDLRLREESPANDAGFDFSSDIGNRDKAGVIRAKGSGWDIGAYEYVSGVADTTSPTQPQNLTGQAVSSSRIDLSWNAATDEVGVIGYKVYRDGDELPWTSATPTYSDTRLDAETTRGLDADTTYTYRVSAYDAAGNESLLSDPVEIHTLSVDSEPPTTPQNLKATPFSSTRIDLTWGASTDNRDVTGYRITRDGADIAATSGTDYSDTGLSHSTEYSYAVLAYDAEGNESALSDSTSTRTHCILTVAAENGVVTRIPDLPEYPVGTEVQLIAVPLPGHVFSAWGGDASGAANPVTIAMDSAKSVTAVFTLIGGGDLVFSLMSDSEQISPVTLSGNAFSANGMREVALWGTWSGVWQEEASEEWNALSDEILSNGGFESFSGGIATGWNLQSDGTIAFTAASDAGRSGTAQRIHVAAAGSWGLFFYQTPAFELGKEYEWTLWYKTSGANGIRAQVCNGPQTQVVFNQNLDGTNGAWRNVTLTFTYDNALATQLRVWANSVGTFWIDDFSLRALDESGEYPTNVAASFDVALPQGPYSWRFLGTDTEGSAFSETRNVTVYPGVRPEASIDDVAVSEGDNATTTSAIFTVSLSSATTASMSVDYALVDGSATVADNDYQSSTGTLQFPPGATTRTLTVVVRGDDSVESHETFIVNLSNPTNVTIADGQGVGTILNDDTYSGNPSVPQDLAATADSQTEIRLTWTASTDDVGVTGYRIFRGSVEIGTDADTVYLDTGLQPSTTYTYHVSAFDVDGNDSMWSAPASAQTNDPPPSSTPGISISDVIVTEGDAGMRSATFDVTLSSAPTLPVTVSYATGDGTATAAGDDYVPTSGTLAFNGSTAAQIQVMVQGDIAVESNETFVVDLSNPTNAAFVKSRGVSTILNDDTGDEEAPSAPTSLAATDVSDTRIRLSWTASTDNVGVAGYRIYRDGAAIATTAEVSYEDTGLSPLTVYAYRVSAYDAAGNESPQSGPPLSVQTDEPRVGEPEISISDVSLSEGNDGLVNAVLNVTLSFFDPFLPVTVQYATSDGTATAASGDYDSVSGTLDFDEPLETITVPVHGDTIAEPDEILFVNLWNPSYATIKRRQGVGGILNDDTDTEAPSTSTLHALAVSDTMIYLSWISSTDNVAVSGYRIYRDGEPIGANTLPSAAPSYVDAWLNEMTTYTYQVSAYDASGNESSMSNSASDRTGPVTPTGLRASAGDGWVHLVWDDPDVNPYGYSVYRSTVSGGPYSLLNTETHITSPAYLDTNVTGGATYYYVVAAYNLPFREWPYSDEVSAAPRNAPTPTPTSTPGPPLTPTSTPTATVSPTSTSAPTVTATPEEPIRDLIHSFYLVLLGRDPEPGAVDAWHHGYFDSAVSFNIDVRFIPREMARLFFLSEEYANRGRTDSEFITDCYRVFLNRDPNPNELDAWLAGAWNRSQVMTVFSESEEFANRIAAMYPGLEGDPTRNFVTFMYIGLLDRLVDQNGLEYASGLFDAAFASGGIEAVRAQAKQMAREVIVSEEFLGKNPTTADYVVRFYRAFLGRFPSDTEVAYWSGELNSGRRTRDNVIDLFADSTEFTTRLEEYFG